MIPKGANILNVDKLVFAIIKCAVDDYKAELKGKTRFYGKGDCKGNSGRLFLESETFQYLSGLNGEMVIKRIKGEEETKKKKKRR
nr:MAG TPA: hypothetical protein [Caudoviricetes sp.]